MSPLWHQAIIWTVGGILSIGPLETHWSECWLNSNVFIWESVFEDLVCKMTLTVLGINMRITSWYSTVDTVVVNCTCSFAFLFGLHKNNKKWVCEYDIMEYDFSCLYLCSKHAHVRLFPIKRQLSGSYFVVLSTMHYREKCFCEFYISIWKVVSVNKMSSVVCSVTRGPCIPCACRNYLFVFFHKG